MKRLLTTAAIVAGTWLAGCTQTVSEGGQAVPDAAPIAPLACNVSRAEAFVGKPADAVAEDARLAAGAKNIRVIRPGTMVTMDYRGDRLNLKTDDAGAVVSVSCG